MCTIWGPVSLSKHQRNGLKSVLRNTLSNSTAFSFSKGHLSSINLATDTSVFVKMPLAIKLSVITFVRSKQFIIILMEKNHHSV